jgi:uncharacterized protein
MVQMRIARILLGSLVWFFCDSVANAQSPSFDCNKANLPDEIAICRSSQLAELDNLVAAGYAFLKSTQGRPAADRVGFPFWRLRQSCQWDEPCIQQRQIEAIKAYQAAGAPVTLPSWASLQFYGSNSGGSTENPQVAPLAPPARSGAEIGDTTVQMVSDGGTFKVPVTVNGQLTLNFIVDSGASDVSIPADVFMTLVRTGTITDADYLDKRTYKLADGSTTPSQRFVIRSLKVGDKTLENVVGSIARVEGDLLLGQSFLSRFDSWSIDNHLQALVLRSSSSAANSPAPPPQSVAAAPSAIAGSQSRSLCAGQGTDDVVRPIPPSLYDFANKLFGEEAASNTVYRCMSDRVFVCPIGNGFSCDRPSTDRRNPSADQYCRENPGSDFVPMAASGHGTIYTWKCAGGRALIDFVEKLDERGFRADAWNPLFGMK